MTDKLNKFRTERDTMGEVSLPATVYYGAQTQRAVENFPISGKRIAPELVHALGWVKWGAAKANEQLGQLTVNTRKPLTLNEIEALQTATIEVACGKHDSEFPVDVYQTGSGTSSNMNANEVIANRAMELAGYDRFSSEKKIHPNDHVNCGQSTNDIFPTAIHVAVALALQNDLIPVLVSSKEILFAKSQQWQEILKIGRTHLADATPLSLGQEIGGMARQLELAVVRAKTALEQILELPVGGTAVGTGINTHRQFGRIVCDYLAKEMNIPFREASDHFEANAQRDGLVTCHALLKAIAVSLYSIANNIRWLASGPRCGFREIILEDLQPGSSIMPGKVNPVLCESIMQVTARVIGNDQTISFAGASGGQFQLNIMMPVMADVVLDSIRIMTGSIKLFNEKCLLTMEPDEERCRQAVEQSLALVTALNPLIGYEKAASLAKEAFHTNKTIRQLCLELKILPADELERALDPWQMTKPSE